MSLLADGLAKLAATVLPEGTPDSVAVPAAMVAGDLVSSRTRLEGSIVECQGGVFLLVPPGASPLTAGSKKLAIAASGDEDEAIDKTDTQISSYMPRTVMYGVVTGASAAGAKAPTIKVHGLPAVVRAVASAAGFTQVTVAVNGGAASPVAIASLAALIDQPWLPWDGAPGGPPPILAAAAAPAPRRWLLGARWRQLGRGLVRARALELELELGLKRGHAEDPRRARAGPARGRRPRDC